MSHYNRLIIEKKLKEFIEEDCNFADVSSSVIPENAETTAKIIAKSAGYISGLKEVEIIYDILNVSTVFKKKEGEAFKEGDLITELQGKTRDILLGERIGLNLLTHMSAITSTTKKFVEIIKIAGKNVKIACTRKTTPGLRIFEKKAVELGGGDPHRFSLDEVLLKDTHLRFYKGDIEKLLRDVKKKVSFTKKIELEIEEVGDVLPAARYGADIVAFPSKYSPIVADKVRLPTEPIKLYLKPSLKA